MYEQDVIIIGGGLAGLTAAIHLSQKKIKVLLVEKNSYPQHKVCGEYLSNEIKPYFKFLGINLNNLSPAKINRLMFTTQKGKSVETGLDLGGMGISRYCLDNFLYKKAKEAGVEFLEAIVNSVKFQNEFQLEISTGRILTAPIVLGSFGKRSNLDKTLNRNFFQQKSSWLAVKAHYSHSNFPEDLVALHNFNGGYCGLSQTETQAINVCYLVSYKSFKKHKNTDDFRKNVLFSNPHLKAFFRNADPLFEKDLSIAQISFQKKSLVENHILMLGDAAGLIHPLCGNGMAMAIHSAKIASEVVLRNFKDGKLNRNNLEDEYQINWKANFNDRVKTAGILQKILINPFLAETSQNLVKNFPPLLNKIISKTHGQPII